MRLKLRIQRSAGLATTDVLIDSQGEATVGDLARFLLEADPAGSQIVTDEPTLAVEGPSGRALDARVRLEDSGIFSGAIVSLRSAHEHSDSRNKSVTAAAKLRVIEGPDAPREFELRRGVNVIGRDPGCDVVLTDSLVSRRHARIYVSNVIEIVDNGSANGTLSEGKPVDQLIVYPGDVLVAGDTSFSISALHRPAAMAHGTVLFNRPPVLNPSYEGAHLEAPSPPEPAPRSRFPVLSLLMPLVLGVVLYVATKSVMDLLFIGLSPLMLVGNLVEGQFTGRKTTKQANADFQGALAKLEATARAHLLEERAARIAASPSIAECMTAAAELTPLLWSRSWATADSFLRLRLGAATLPSLLTIKLPTRSKGDQQQWDELVSRTSAFGAIDLVPLTCHLTEDGHLGVGGAESDVLGLARSLIIQACVLSPPGVLSLAVCAARANDKEWSWVKWLPHVKLETGSLSVETLCASQMSCDLLTEDLERIVAERRTAKRSDVSAASDSGNEAILVVIADGAPINRSRLVAIAQDCASVGIYFLWLANAVDQLPAICSTFVNLEHGLEHAVAGFVADGVEYDMVGEGMTFEEALQCSLRLSPVVDAAARGSEVSGLPQAVSFLRLAGLGVAEDPDLILERWSESRSILRGPRAIPREQRRPGTLRALLGESTSGPYVLDLRNNGPHALVGGTTGSGKSELLQSWILGMAVAHSPQRVTFLLVDYKGGSAFRECVHLPHTVGLVTDLTPYLVRRALVSFRAELKYREELLHRRNAKDLVELERIGDPDAPPSLVVVVDEFAALVQEVPEFVDGMVNIAQRGRSLGLHLILATQRPANVIKDNLRANTNLRLALRMADASDSSDVLGVADAAYFDPDIPGRAGTRSGPSRLHLFQAAYSGGFTSKEADPPVFNVINLDFDGGQPWERPLVQSREKIVEGATDIQRIVETVCAASDRAQIEPPRRPWLDALAPLYRLEELASPRRDDEIVFGVADVPDLQRRESVAFFPDRDGNLAVVGTGGSGKSTVLRTLAIGAANTIRGGPIQVYGLDFGSRGLQMLADLPHVGSVVPGQDIERVGRLLDWLRELIDERAVRFSAVDAGTITDYRRIAQAPSEPRIFLLLDGMSAFRSAFESSNTRFMDLLTGIAGDGRPVGVHVLISADRFNAIPISLASHLQRRIVFRLADAGDYSTLGVPTDVLTSQSPPGRGLLDGLEIQVATLGGTPDLVVQAREVRAYGGALSRGGVEQAPAIESLPDRIMASELPQTVDGLPVFGKLSSTLGPATLQPSGIFIVTGPRGSGRSTAVRTIVAALRQALPESPLFYIGGKKSELQASDFWVASGVAETDIRTVVETVKKASTQSSPMTLVLEGIEQLVGSPLDTAIRECVSALVDGGHFVLAEGDISAMSQIRDLPMLLKTSRTGLALMPDPNANLSGIFGADFPRFRRSEFCEGRGFFVQRGRMPDVVQVAIS